MNLAGSTLDSRGTTTLELRAISGTANYLILRRNSAACSAMLVAEIVLMPDGFTIYRMDATGVLGSGFATPATALEFFEEWVHAEGTFRA